MKSKVDATQQVALEAFRAESSPVAAVMAWCGAISNLSFTAGPWVVREVHPGRSNTPMLQVAHSAEPGTWAVCQIVRGTRSISERRANARLLAAAPDLYAACSELIHGDGTADSMQRVIDMARAALAKVDAR
jgi:hypothetical protein